MILNEMGKLARELHAIGNIIFPGYVLTGNENIMFDAGITALGPVYYRELERLLGDASRLNMILITHAHFDHIGSVPYLKKRIPNLQICASPLLRDVLSRPRVVEKIQDISREYERIYADGGNSEEIAFTPFDIDMELSDGMEFDLGNGVKIKAIATPGHTPECYCFYIPHAKALICGEALGMPDFDLQILPEFLSSYDDYMNSLHKVSKLDIDKILLPHGAILTDEHAADYIERSIKTTKNFKDKIQKMLNKYNCDQEKTAVAMAEDPLAKSISQQQGERAFMLNLKAQIKTVAEMSGK